MSFHKGIIGLSEDLKICKIPFQMDFSKGVKLFYPSKNNYKCKVSESSLNGQEYDKLDLMWEDHLNFCYSQYEAFMEIKEHYLSNRKRKRCFFLKRKDK